MLSKPLALLPMALLTIMAMADTAHADGTEGIRKSVLLNLLCSA